jgi:hypothetical protein
MINGYGTIDGMIIGRRNQTTRRKPALVLLFPSQIPHDLTWSEIEPGSLLGLAKFCFQVPKLRKSGR